MKVLFLCGGVGKRMYPMTEEKYLLKFLGNTLLEHQMRLALEVGLRDFILVSSPQNVERVRQIAAGVRGTKSQIAVQEQSLGIANAVQSAAKLLDGEFIIANPDDLIEKAAYTSLLADRARTQADACLLGYRVKDYFPGGYLVVNEGGELTHIVEKPGKGKEPSDLVNVLVHLHADPKLLLDHISHVQSDRDDVYERALDAMCRDKHRIRVVPYTGIWHAIKYPWHVFEAVRFFMDRAEGQVSPQAKVSSLATLDGKVIVEEGARIHEYAVVRGPAYIGKGTVIGNSTLVRGYSHIGADCVVGFATEIKGAYIADGCWFHMNYVGDSVVGERCNFGAGTITANWRFDEQPVCVKIGDAMMNTGLEKLGAFIGNGCRTGVNVTIMPGVRIGPNAIIAPATCVTRDVEADAMVVGHSPARPLRRSAGGKRVDESRGEG